MRLCNNARRFLLYTIVCFYTGCSVIGVTIGHRYDSSSPPTTVIEWDDMVTARYGTPMRVLLRNGETIEGRFDGFSELPDSDYAVLYDDMKQSLFITGYVPDIGDTVSCMLTSGTAIEAPFVGFDWGYMVLSLSESGEMRKVPLAKLDRVVNHAGTSVGGDRLKNYVDWGEVPLVRTVCLQTDEGTVTVLPHEVSTVTCVTIARKPVHGKVLGLLVGAAVDIAVVVMLFSDNE